MAVPIVDDDQADTTVHLKDLYRDNNDADDSGDSNKRTAAELKVIRDRNRFDKAKMTKGHSVVVLCTAIACVVTVFKQWVHEELADNRNTAKDLSVSYQRSKIKDNKSIQLTMKEYFKTKEFLHGFVKTFQCIPQQLLDIFMLKPQEYNKYIDGKIDLSSSMNDSMQFEWSRLSSFANFSNSNISVIRLAEAGFYYQGNGDEVSCYFCELKHKNWNSRDNPSTIHKEHSPHCAFVRKNLNSKIPKSEDTVKPLPERQIGIESIGACGSRTDTIAVKSDTKLNKTCMNHEQNVGDTTNISPGAPEPLLAGASVNQGDDEQLSVVRANQDIEHNQNLATFNAHDSNASLLRSEEGRPRLEQQRSTMYNNSGTMDFQTSNQRGPNQTFNNFSRNDTTGLIPIQNFDTAAHYSNRSSQHVPSETTLTATFNQDNIGVCVEKPKYPKYAVRATRLSSFLNWSLHLTQTPEELTTSGFFYTGTEDHCRCFFCGGGLRRWEVGDLPWTEHARWFPKCPFVIQCKGEKFIDDVQKGRNTENAERRNTEEQTIQSHGINGFTNNPAVQTILEFGYEMVIVKTAYTNLRRAGIEDITASLLLETLYEMTDSNQHTETSTVQNQNSNIKTDNVPSQISNKIGNEDRKENLADVDPSLELSIRSLEEENRNLKDQQTCKICLDEPVAIVFLPCGHMAACVNCAPALRRCPICRAFIKGTVKAIIC